MATKEENKVIYLSALKAAGYRSWKQANLHRGDLIMKSTRYGLSADELTKLELLQKCCDCYLAYKCFESLEDQQKMLVELEAKLEKHQFFGDYNE